MYTKNFNPERYKDIKDILEKIQALEPGSRLSIKGLRRDEIHQLRWLLYDWMFHMGIKSKFQLRQDENELIVRRKGKMKFELETQGITLPSDLDSLLRELLLLTEEEMLARLREEEISEEDRIKVERGWRRVMM